MKRVHFNWTNVICVQEGTDEQFFFLPPNFVIPPGENRSKCFLSISTVLKGRMQMVFKSEYMRNKCLNGFQNLVTNSKVVGEVERDEADFVSNTSSTAA